MRDFVPRTSLDVLDWYMLAILLAFMAQVAIII